jgi:hypothetical protein
MTRRVHSTAFEPDASDLARQFRRLGATNDERATAANVMGPGAVPGYFRLASGRATGGNFFSNGAQKYQISPLTRQAPQGSIGVSPAEIAEIAKAPRRSDVLHPQVAAGLTVGSDAMQANMDATEGVVLTERAIFLLAATSEAVDRVQRSALPLRPQGRTGTFLPTNRTCHRQIGEENHVQRSCR